MYICTRPNTHAHTQSTYSNVLVQEGSEPENFFWVALGGRKDYERVSRLPTLTYSPPSHTTHTHTHTHTTHTHTHTHTHTECKLHEVQPALPLLQ